MNARAVDLYKQCEKTVSDAEDRYERQRAQNNGEVTPEMESEWAEVIKNVKNLQYLASLMDNEVS